MTDTFIWYPPKKRTAHMPYGQAGTGGYSLPVAGIMVCSPWKNVKRFLRNIIIKDKKNGGFQTYRTIFYSFILLETATV